MEDVRYAVSGGASIAYHVSGAGPGLVHLGNFGTNMEALEVTLEVRLWFERLAGATRFVMYDQRGTGLSDRDTTSAGLEVWVADLEAVLDAANMPQATLVAQDLAGPVAIAFAARHPERVAGLVLLGTYGRLRNGGNYDAGLPPEVVDLFPTVGAAGWGVPESELNRLMMPGRENLAWRQEVSRVQRLSVSPHGLGSLVRSLVEVDVTRDLAGVRAPTLVVHNTGDRLIPVTAGRYLAEHISGARMVEFDTNQHFVFFEYGEACVDEILAAIGLGGSRRVGTHQLAAVWFSDIVGSTEQLRSSGDRAWRQRLEEHDLLADHLLRSYGGQLVKRLGDGILALFTSTQDAVRCAARFAAACDRIDLPVRIGIHVGDVDRRPDGDILGLAVHTAQRVEAAAEPGQILVTSTAAGALAGGGFDLHPIGSRTLKGIAEVELHEVRGA